LTPQNKSSRNHYSFEPTPEQRRTVEMLSAMGVPQEKICLLILSKRGKPIDLKTLRKYFRLELDTGSTKANQAVAGALYKKAIDPDGGSPSVTAAIFWLKTRARWSEKTEVELSGSVDGIRKIERIIIDPENSDAPEIPAPSGEEAI
jgi:hypothetical protein